MSQSLSGALQILVMTSLQFQSGTCDQFRLCLAFLLQSCAAGQGLPGAVIFGVVVAVVASRRDVQIVCLLVFRVMGQCLPGALPILENLPWGPSCAADQESLGAIRLRS